MSRLYLKFFTQLIGINHLLSLIHHHHHIIMVKKGKAKASTQPPLKTPSVAEVSRLHKLKEYVPTEEDIFKSGDTRVHRISFFPKTKNLMFQTQRFRPS